jgi:predicted transcriptional regulator
VSLDVNKIRKLIGDQSQAEVALKAGMMQPALARILSGKLDPKLSTVEKLAKALGCRVRDLISD